MQQEERAELSQIQVVCAMDTAAKSRMSNETALFLTKYQGITAYGRLFCNTFSLLTPNEE